MNCKVYEESVFFPGTYERIDDIGVALPRDYDQDETEKIICNRFKDIDFQLKHDKTAEIIFSDKYFNKPIESSNRKIHWYYVGEILKERYKYVAMERLDKDYNSVEKNIQRIGYDGNSWSMLTFDEFKELDVSHFKFIIWKNQIDFNRNYDRKLRQYFDF